MRFLQYDIYYSLKFLGLCFIISVVSKPQM